MGLFKIFDKHGRYLSEQSYNDNLDSQLQMNTETLDELRAYDVTDEAERKIEFFFYTNTLDKAKTFGYELGKLYSDVSYGESENEDKLFVVTGWTHPMNMSLETMNNWTRKMCEMGYEFDCDFDGWGTNVD